MGHRIPHPLLTPTLTFSPVPQGKGAVVGGVEFCEASGFAPYHPTYESGTVLALRGTVSLVPGPVGSEVVLPTSVAASTSVATNQLYRFVLDPGHYVLEARLGGPNELADTVGPYAPITVRSGVTSFAPIPNHCK